MINGEKACARHIDEVLCNVYSFMCVWECGFLHRSTRKRLGSNRFSLCLLQALPPPQPWGYLCLPAVSYLTEALEKHQNLLETLTRAANLTQTMKSVAHLSLSLAVSVFLQQPQQSDSGGANLAVLLPAGNAVLSALRPLGKILCSNL